MPECPFSHVHIDTVGSLPPHRYTHLLTCFDQMTRWSEAIPVSYTIYESYAWAFIGQWVTWSGVPSNLTSNKGLQFCSSLWHDIADALRVTLHQTTACHPQSNGMVECMHCLLMSALHSRLTYKCWADKLPLVLLGIRTTHKLDLNCSHSDLVLRHFPSLWANCCLVTLCMFQGLSAPSSTHHVTPLLLPGLDTCLHTFVCDDSSHGPHQPSCCGPFKILSCSSNTIELLVWGQPSFVSIDHCKPSFLSDSFHSDSSVVTCS